MPPWFKIQDQTIVRVSVSATLQAHKLLEQCGHWFDCGSPFLGKVSNRLPLDLVCTMYLSYIGTHNSLLTSS